MLFAATLPTSLCPSTEVETNPKASRLSWPRHAACSSPLVVHMYSTNTVPCCVAINHDCTASALLLEYELYFSAPAMPVLRHPTPTCLHNFCATPIRPASNCAFDKESIRSCYLASIIAKGSRLLVAPARVVILSRARPRS